MGDRSGVQLLVQETYLSQLSLAIPLRVGTVSV